MLQLGRNYEEILSTLNYFLFFPTYLLAGTCGSDTDGEGTTHTTGTAPWTADSASLDDVHYCVDTAASTGGTFYASGSNINVDNIKVYDRRLP